MPDSCSWVTPVFRAHGAAARVHGVLRVYCSTPLSSERPFDQLTVGQGADPRWQLICKRTGMAKPSPKSIPQQGMTQEIRPDQWIPFFAEFTQEYRGAHARVDVFGPDVGYQVETDDRPFDGIAADIKDGARSVWISFGTTPADHLTHGIHEVSAVRLLLPAGPAGPALEIE